MGVNLRANLRQGISMDFTIQIPVRSHIKKYLVQQCNGEPYRVKRSDLIGSFILNILSKVPSDYIPVNNSGESFTCIIGHKHSENEGLYIRPDNEKLFDKFVDLLFKKELFTHLSINNRHQIDIISDFMEIFDINNDDIDFDSMRRAYHRYRLKFEMN